MPPRGTRSSQPGIKSSGWIPTVAGIATLLFDTDRPRKHVERVNVLKLLVLKD